MKLSKFWEINYVYWHLLQNMFWINNCNYDVIYSTHFKFISIHKFCYFWGLNYVNAPKNLANFWRTYYEKSGLKLIGVPEFLFFMQLYNNNRLFKYLSFHNSCTVTTQFHNSCTVTTHFPSKEPFLRLTNGVWTLGDGKLIFY